MFTPTPIIFIKICKNFVKIKSKVVKNFYKFYYNEQIFFIDSENAETTKEYVVRETIRRVSTPQAYNATMIIDLYKRAFLEEKGISGSSYADTLMTEYGQSVFYSMGSDKNIKIIDQDDLNLFKAFLQKENANWLK